jgi:effector-binding domain-containing protein
MTNFEIVTRSEQPTAVVHETVTMAELPQFFARAFGGVMGALRQQGVNPAGPPFAHYLGMPGETVEVEAGFPVERGLLPEGPVHASALPAAKCVHGVHVGPYDAMTKTYGELAAWAKAKGLHPHHDMWEVYWSGPQLEPDPKTWRTEIFWPVD